MSRIIAISVSGCRSNTDSVRDGLMVVVVASRAAYPGSTPGGRSFSRYRAEGPKVVNEMGRTQVLGGRRPRSGRRQVGTGLGLGP